jgi:hypothetical protein
MKNKIYLSSAKARSFAECNWGYGGTNQVKTTRRGAYYFSCSGHGGYVVDANALSVQEYENIVKYAKPEKCFVTLVDGEVKFFQNPITTRRQRYKLYQNMEQKTVEVFFFEEDCDWAILEKFTDIRLVGGYEDLAKHEEAINGTFTRWHEPKAA